MCQRRAGGASTASTQADLFDDEFPLRCNMLDEECSPIRPLPDLLDCGELVHRSRGRVTVSLHCGMIPRGTCRAEKFFN